jgi:hypothetical protein
VAEVANGAEQSIFAMDFVTVNTILCRRFYQGSIRQQLMLLSEALHYLAQMQQNPPMRVTARLAAFLFSLTFSMRWVRVHPHALRSRVSPEFWTESWNESFRSIDMF